MRIKPAHSSAAKLIAGAAMFLSATILNAATTVAPSVTPVITAPTFAGATPALPGAAPAFDAYLPSLPISDGAKATFAVARIGSAATMDTSMAVMAANGGFSETIRKITHPFTIEKAPDEFARDIWQLVPVALLLSIPFVIWGLLHSIQRILRRLRPFGWGI